MSTDQERRLHHRKQSTVNAETVSGVNANDLQEGVPRTFYIKGSGVYDVVKINGKLYYSVKYSSVKDRLDDVEFDTVSGSKLGTSSLQKIGFLGANPVGRQTATSVSNPPTQAEVTAIRDALINLGLMDST